MRVTLAASLRAGDDVVFRELDGEAVLLNLSSGVYFGLDDVGTRMWQLIGEHGSLRAVLAQLCDEYDAAPEVLERDLVELASRLVARGLVVARP
jgi:hypothetical protein